MKREGLPQPHGRLSATTPPQQRNRLVATGLIVTLLLVQLWLLVGTVEGTLAGEDAFPLFSLVASGCCFVVVWQLARREQVVARM